MINAFLIDGFTLGVKMTTETNTDTQQRDDARRLAVRLSSMFFFLYLTRSAAHYYRSEKIAIIYGSGAKAVGYGCRRPTAS